MYAQCPHLQEIESAQIGDEVGFDSKQINILFQNKRNQLKVISLSF